MGFSVHAKKTIGSLLFASLSAMGGLVFGVGCDDPQPATARVALRTTFGVGSEVGVNDQAKCGLATEPWLDIGELSDRSKVKYVLDGDTTGTPPTPVHVVCTVKEAGTSLFAVDANVTIDNVGSLTIHGNFAPTGTQQNISTVWQRADTGSFEQPDCTASFDADPVMGVAKGRVWGTLRCPHATFSEQSRTCLGTAEFRFENCAQQ